MTLFLVPLSSHLSVSLFLKVAGFQKTSPIPMAPRVFPQLRHRLPTWLRLGSQGIHGSTKLPLISFDIPLKHWLSYDLSCLSWILHGIFHGMMKVFSWPFSMVKNMVSRRDNLMGYLDWWIVTGYVWLEGNPRRTWRLNQRSNLGAQWPVLKLPWDFVKWNYRIHGWARLVW